MLACVRAVLCCAWSTLEPQFTRLFAAPTQPLSSHFPLSQSVGSALAALLCSAPRGEVYGTSLLVALLASIHKRRFHLLTTLVDMARVRCVAGEGGLSAPASDFRAHLLPEDVHRLIFAFISSSKTMTISDAAVQASDTGADALCFYLRSGKGTWPNSFLIRASLTKPALHAE